MPKFELVPLEEAEVSSATGKRAEIIREYMGYLEQLKDGQAGKLQVGEGETPAALRRRLGAAARLAGKELVIRRADDIVYFWVQPDGRRRRRGPGRPKKS